MSYILDALRRSQAERERGQVPGLDAQPVAGSPAPVARRPGQTLWLGLAVGLALGLSAAVAAWWGARPPSAPTTVATAQGSPSTVATAPTDAAPAALPSPAVWPTPAPTPAPFPIVVSAPPPPAPRPLPSIPTAAPQAVASAAEAQPVPLAQLAPAQRRELPALSVGGVIWSESPASRFVILDGQVVREGADVAPGLKLLQIERNAAILGWRGQRLRLSL